MDATQDSGRAVGGSAERAGVDMGPGYAPGTGTGPLPKVTGAHGVPGTSGHGSRGTSAAAVAPGTVTA